MDILDYAYQMEKDGEKLYMDLAEENKGNCLYAIFLSLAKDEAAHAKIIKNKKNGLIVTLTEGASATMDNVFGDIAAFEFSGTKPAQVEIYRAAQEKEKESVALYKKMTDEIEDAKDMAAYLIKQEEEHELILDEIVKAVDRPNAWVESAEFGLREEY